MKWLHDHTVLIRIVPFLFAGLNLYSPYRIFPESPLLVLAHTFVAVVLLLEAILIH
jgi:hypothetical protein